MACSHPRACLLLSWDGDPTTVTTIGQTRVGVPVLFNRLRGLSVDGGQRGTGLSASRITQAHQLVGAVLKYAQRTGKVAKNVALEIGRDEDLPEKAERERRYLSRADLLMLARATGRFESLTLPQPSPPYVAIDQAIDQKAIRLRKRFGDRLGYWMVRQRNTRRQQKMCKLAQTPPR